MEDLTHFLRGTEFKQEQFMTLINLALTIKANPDTDSHHLRGKTLVLLFDKESLRTRISFVVAIQQLGGVAIESLGNSRKKEKPRDMVRVLENYCHGLIVRTYDNSDLEEMARYSSIPIINALTNDFHPCQIVADIMTIQNHFPYVKDVRLCYLGDGNNVLNSLLLMLPYAGISVHYCCPEGHGPSPLIIDEATRRVKKYSGGSITAYDNPDEAVVGCHVLYTDVWTSMGDKKKDETVFTNHQVNEKKMSLANPEAIFMHCMPMERGKEVSSTLPDSLQSVIFEQSANRLYAQKALLKTLIQKEGT